MEQRGIVLYRGVLMKKEYAIYSRKSKFTGKGESVENQIEMCREYIKLHFGKEASVGAMIFEDEGYSGKSLARPQFSNMMKAVNENKICAIVCYRLDRISRNIGDFSNLITKLGELGVSFISIREQFDTGSPLGRAMMYIASVFSQLERETIAQRIRDNLRELAKTGRWLGGTTPTGYISSSEATVNLNGKTKKACHLKIKEDEAETVRLVFSLYLATDSLTETESYLLSRNIKTKTGKNFTRSAIKGILKNPVYMIADENAKRYFEKSGVEVYADESDFDSARGIIAYNRTEQEQGKANRQNDISQWIVSVGKHEGIISGKGWINAQILLERNKSASYKKERSKTALLSGLLKCQSCGSFMRPHMTSRLSKNGEAIYYYTCSLKLKSKGQLCFSKNANGNKTDKEIFNTVIKNGEQLTVVQKRLALREHIKEVIWDGERAHIVFSDGEENEMYPLCKYSK